MDWRDFAFAPYYSPCFHYAAGLPMPMLFPRYGNVASRGDSEEDLMAPPNERRPKWLRRLQKAGIAGPMVAYPGDPYAAMILPPW